MSALSFKRQNVIVLVERARIAVKSERHLIFHESIYTRCSSSFGIVHAQVECANIVRSYYQQFITELVFFVAANVFPC